MIHINIVCVGKIGVGQCPALIAGGEGDVAGAQGRFHGLDRSGGLLQGHALEVNPLDHNPFRESGALRRLFHARFLGGNLWITEHFDAGANNADHHDGCQNTAPDDP